MKKTILLLGTLLGFVIHIFAQQKNSSTLSLHGGPSIPIGKFEYSGYANFGTGIGITYSRQLKPLFGYSLSANYQRFPLNVKRIQDIFTRLPIQNTIWVGSDPWQTPPPGSGTRYPNWQFKKDNWNVGSILGGAFREFKTGNAKLSFNTSAMIGVVYAKTPEVEGSSITDTATAFVHQNKRSAWGFSYSLGGAMKCQFNKIVTLVFDISYAGTNEMTFKKIKSTVTTTKGTPGSPGYTVYNSVRTSNGKQVINAIHTRVGLSFTLIDD